MPKMPEDSYFMQKIVFILCVSSTVVSILTIITVIVYLSLEGPKTTETLLIHQQYVCPRDVEDLKLSEEQRNSSNQIVYTRHCEKISTELSKHFKRILSPPEPDEPKKIVSPLGLGKAFAHRRMVHSDPESDDDLRFMAKGKGQMRELHRNVKINASGIIIQLKGFYHVYSSVYVKPRNTVCKFSQNMTFFHEVMRLRSELNQEEEPLLHDTHRLCIGENTHAHNTSYIDGGFVLEPGDILKVKVSNVSFVRYRKESTFFGVMMLTDMEDG